VVQTLCRAIVSKLCRTFRSLVCRSLTTSTFPYWLTLYFCQINAHGTHDVRIILQLACDLVFVIMLFVSTLPSPVLGCESDCRLSLYQGRIFSGCPKMHSSVPSKSVHRSICELAWFLLQIRSCWIPSFLCSFKGASNEAYDPP
jgi:hypothetical protein